MKADIISGLVFFLMGCYIFFKGTAIPAAELQGGPGAGFFPIFVGILLCGLGLLLALFSYLTRRKRLRQEAAEAPIAPDSFSGADRTGGTRSVMAIVFSLGVYILALPYLGFIVASTLFGVYYLSLFFRKKFIGSLMTSLFIALAGYGLFKIVLSVSLPTFLNKGWF